MRSSEKQQKHKIDDCFIEFVDRGVHSALSSVQNAGWMPKESENFKEKTLGVEGQKEIQRLQGEEIDERSRKMSVEETIWSGLLPSCRNQGRRF